LLVFLVFFVTSRRGGWSPDLVNLPMRLDPLVILANFLSSRVFLAGSAIALLTILLTVVFGRAWCGWVCPLGTILDLFSLKNWRGDRPAPTENLRVVKHGFLIMILVAALMGNLALLALDPLTLLFRTLTTSIWPALERILTWSEGLLYQVPFLSGAVTSLDRWLRPSLFPTEPVYFRSALVFWVIFLGVIALNMLAERFWCRYLCPLGAMLGLVSKIALFRRQVGEDCRGCALCEKACPTGTINPAKAYASDPGECTMCLDCLEACPRSTISYHPRLSTASWNHYDPGRRAFLLSAGAAVAGLALLRSGALAKREPPHLLRPPGARESNRDVLELERCIRCGQCLRACPTSALQPAVFEAGLQGFGTPLVAPRLGYCDYSCNACGLVCPVQAIPPLSLEEKRQQVIGKAYIDQNRCIPWSDQETCVVCEEMCPIPEKAILMETRLVQNSQGEEVNLQLPRVLRERCIGCGICEYKCPVNGEAAIRVYVPQTFIPF
jgi:polyferredoxin